MSRVAAPNAYRMDDTRPHMVDPVTGDSRTGSSVSGREAARVVKFSPEGSSRDLMVFTEVCHRPSLVSTLLIIVQENVNIHIVDAKTLNTQVIIPVLFHAPSGGSERTSTEHPWRAGYDGGVWGIAGIGFDPSGDWLYSGTEKTIVEWDLRRLGGGESSTWGMA
jgi:hypothetical protein